VTLPTISINRDEMTGRVAVDKSIGAALKNIQSNPDTTTNFATAILEFLLLAPHSTEPLAQSYDPLVISFTQGMEMFALGHEYGHVIKNHVSPTMQVRLGTANDKDNSKPPVTVLARSWKQELEADQVGIQLVTQVLRTDAKTGAAEELRWFYSLKGALRALSIAFKELRRNFSSPFRSLF
jgi:hypothetical protein